MSGGRTPDRSALDAAILQRLGQGPARLSELMPLLRALAASLSRARTEAQRRYAAWAVVEGRLQLLRAAGAIVADRNTRRWRMAPPAATDEARP